MMFMWLVFVVMVLVGIVDVCLVVVKRDTISQWYHRLFSQRTDLIIMVAVLACVWIFLGVGVFTGVMAGTILGHLAWHEG